MADDPLEELLRELQSEEPEEKAPEEVAAQQPALAPPLPDASNLPWEPQAIVDAAVEMATVKTALLETAVGELRKEFPELDESELGQIAQQLRTMKPGDLKGFCENGGHRGLGYAMLGMRVKRTGQVPAKRNAPTPVGPEQYADFGEDMIGEIEKLYGPLSPAQKKRLRKELG